MSEPLAIADEAVLPEALAEIGGREIVFFPVRHHSPAAARLVGQCIRETRPAAVLVEGPSDYNDRIDELFLDHALPIAIYSYVSGAGVGRGRMGAFYPFCVYSPEWQALTVAHELGIPARFIDLPWLDTMADGSDTAPNRYADGEMRSSDYVAALCRAAGVETLDAFWDAMIEIEANLSVGEYMRRVHRFCFNVRNSDAHVPSSDIRRERFMAQRIRLAQAEFGAPLLVVTGGFHSHALYERLHGNVDPGADPRPDGLPAVAALADLPRGITLTPYSYQRLDGLAGYDSGMPNPGFYHQAWLDHADPLAAPHRVLLARAAGEMRSRSLPVSSADLIAVETTASALAAMRGHARVWRTDLVDGITGALVKDEITSGLTHPFLAMIYEVFRGSERGRLSSAVQQPPLARDTHRLLTERSLLPGDERREIVLNLLDDAEGLEASRLLHGVRLLALPGYTRRSGPSFDHPGAASSVTETWIIDWAPELDAAMIEASIYGASLADAVIARLAERAARVERDALEASAILLDAGLAGARSVADDYRPEMIALIRSDGDFFRVSQALSNLLTLYRYDELLGTRGDAGYGALVREAYERALWLLESVGANASEPEGMVRAVAALLETVERCASSLNLPRQALVDALRRVGGYGAVSPLLAGATRGALWNLREMSREELERDIQAMAAPELLGDFLTGLFRLARESVQRHPDLVVALDSHFSAYSAEEFLEALPALRLAFAIFAPREKHYMARTLLTGLGLAPPEQGLSLEVSVNTAAQALRFESRVLDQLTKYGLRGGRAHV